MALETSRVEAFSDGVFSIAITLLVLPADRTACDRHRVRLGALVGWFVDPSIALVIFLIFPILSVLRVRSPEHQARKTSGPDRSGAGCLSP
ncbi:MAG: TMEM175 family protein [Chloroflexota bacterium]